jgi:NAD-specific glutamate dehydrogenase
MHDESEMHQLQLERMQMLEEALEKAKAGVATEDDWNIIRMECGLSKRPIVTLETISIRSE